MPLSTRRVVRFCGKSTQEETAIGSVAGLADGAVIIQTKHGVFYELTIEEARDLSSALQAAWIGVEQWQKHARGYHRLRVAKGHGGAVMATLHGRTVELRVSMLRGSRRHGFYRKCYACHEPSPELYIEANRKPWAEKFGAEVCPKCVDELLNAKDEIAEVLPMSTEP